MPDAPDLIFRPVTSANWDDFEALFEAPGAPKYCWCMVWRVNATERHEAKGAQRKPMMKSRIDDGVPVGLLAYKEGIPAAWVSIAPKQTHHRLGGPDPAPGENVWSLTCMFVPKKLRGQGLARRLIAAAVDHARAEGANIVEAYPVDPDSPSYKFMGLVPVFETDGFRDLGMAGTRRHVMRLDLRAN
jgi:GNAT superfamily N-acetyltransferase